MLWFLLAWTGVAGCWWLVALALVVRRRPPPGGSGTAGAPGRVPLAVFKPMPAATRPGERAALQEALGSFVSQLEAGDQLLLGLPDVEEPFWRDVVAAWQSGPGDIRVVCRPPPSDRANPKVAWLEVLAREACTELWVWSDADVVAPPGLLAEMRGLAGRPAARALTSPYFVGRAGSAAALLDAAFVNAEFLPGALLLGRRDALATTFGAATVFRQADFARATHWDDLGRALADDFRLGQRLGAWR